MGKIIKRQKVTRSLFWRALGQSVHNQLIESKFPVESIPKSKLSEFTHYIQTIYNIWLFGTLKN